MKRRPFILLELFIALALLSLSVIPLLSFPLKFYKKELSLLIEEELGPLSDVAFRDLLLDEVKELYTLRIGKHHTWQYQAVWEIERTQVDKNEWLEATLQWIPLDSSLPKPEPLLYEYLIAKKDPPEKGKDHEASDTLQEKTS